MGDKPVVVAAFQSDTEAFIAQSRLRAEGIEAVLGDENLLHYDPLLWVAVGGIKLVVSEQDADAARRILANNEKVVDEEKTCPRCGSRRVTMHHAGRRFAFISMIFLLPIGRARSKARCQDCRHTWRE
ncbi:MAG: DUF2007 domain-containing protein [Planctomycetes bacterium]|nr:DUF2007 domain-containing protein [Planctomycetota bacterium]